MPGLEEFLYVFCNRENQYKFLSQMAVMFHYDFFRIDNTAKTIKLLLFRLRSRQFKDSLDYLTRFMLPNDKLSAFIISNKGAKRVDETFEDNNETRNIMSLIEKVKGLDDNSITEPVESYAMM